MVLLTAGGFLTYQVLEFRTTITSNLKSVADILRHSREMTHRCSPKVTHSISN